MLVVLLGMTALGTEIGLVLFKRQNQQMAADAAAFGGVIALQNGQSNAGITLEAKAIAANIHYVDGSDGVAVTVNHPPILSAAQAGNSNAVEVVIEQPQTLTLANLIGSTYGSGPIAWNVKASAVAGMGGSGSCLVALNTTACGAITIQNNAIVQPPPCVTNGHPHCGVAANSTCSSAIVLKNNAQINAPVRTPGNWSLSNGAKLNCPPNVSGASAGAGPLQGRPASAHTRSRLHGGASLPQHLHEGM